MNVLWSCGKNGFTKFGIFSSITVNELIMADFTPGGYVVDCAATRIRGTREWHYEWLDGTLVCAG